MKRLFLFLLFAVALRADLPIISGVGVLEKTHNCVMVTWTTDEPCASCGSHLRYDDPNGGSYDPDNLVFRMPSGNPSSGSTTFRRGQTCDGIPGAEIALQPVSWDSGAVNVAAVVCSGTCGGVECTSANSSGLFRDGSGMFCPVSGEPPVATLNTHPTGGASIPLPTAPTHTLDLSIDPACDTVVSMGATVDGLQTALNAAAAETSDNVCVQVDPGIYSPSDDSSSNGNQWIIPTHSTGASNWIILETTPSKMLPPFGYQVDPTFKPHLAVFKYNEDWWANIFNSDAERSLFQDSGSASGNWRFRNVAVAPPNNPAIVTYTLTNATGQGGQSAGATVTTSSDISDLQIRAMLQLDVAGPQGFQQFCLVVSVNVGAGTFDCFETYSNSATFVSGTAKQVGRVSVNSCSISGANTVCTLAEDNPFPAYEQGNITDIAAGDVLTLTDNRNNLHLITSDTSRQTVRLKGTADCDDIRTITSYPSGTQLDLAGTSVCSACSSGNCGVVEKLPLIDIASTSNSTLNMGGAYHYEPGPASNQITLLNVTEAATGGHIGSMSVGWTPPFSVGNISGIVFDRVLWLRNEKHSFWGATSQNEANGVGYVGTWWDVEVVDGLVDPVNGRAWNQLFLGTTLQQGAAGIYGTRELDDTQISKHTSISSGFHLFKDVSGTADDWTVEAFTAFSPKRYISGNAKSTGRYHHNQNMFEFKGSQRLDFSFIMSGGHASRSQVGAALTFLNTGTTDDSAYAVQRDIDLHDFAIINNNSAIHFTDGNSPDQRQRISARFRAHNFLVVNDTLEFWDNPHPICGTAPCTQGGFLLGAPPASSSITNFAYIPRRVRHSSVMQFLGTHRRSEALITDGITLFSEGQNNVGGFTSHSGVGSFTPAIASDSGEDFFLGIFRRIDGADPLTGFTGNVILPGLEDSYNRTVPADWLSTNTSIRITAAETAANAGLDGLTTGNTIPNEANTQDALDACFEPAEYAPLGSGDCAGKGPDVAAISDAQYFIRNPTIARLSDTSVRVSLTAPNTTDPCWIQWTTRANGFGAGSNTSLVNEWQEIAEGAQARTFDITGLTAGVYYTARLTCGRNPIRASFRAGS